MNPSLQAYEQVKVTLTKRHIAVYEAIKEHPGMCIKETANLLGKLPNEISGRFTELSKVHAIVPDGCSGVRECSMCASATHWKVNDVIFVEFSQVKRSVKNPARVTAGGCVTPDQFKVQRSFLDAA